MPELQGSRRKLQIAIAAMVAADLLALAVLFSPLVGSAESRQITMGELSAELQKKKREMEPLKGIDKKIFINLIRSMPSRLKQVIESDGNKISY